jgi:glycerate 2-kinase
VLNRNEIINNATTSYYKRLREDAIEIAETALTSVDPRKAIENLVKLENKRLIVDKISIDLNKIRRLIVVGGGKAGYSMAEAVEQLLGDYITAGSVNVPKGTKRLKKINLTEAGHPIPDSNGVKGVKNIFDLVSDSSPDDLIIALISGGGSAMMPMPAENITLEDLKKITKQLLRAGATINELNAVRKHLSEFKGGGLARRCYPAKVLSFIISDVVGDPIDTIASGPTSHDPTTFKMAIEVLKKYGLWAQAPASVRRRLDKGLRGQFKETPKEGDPVFRRVSNIIIANNLIAANAAARKSSELGYNTSIISTFIEGEARQVGVVFSGLARGVINQSTPLSPPGALLLGGETTVTVTGGGRGGRNQEVALGAAKHLQGLNCLILTLGTDGVDGSSDAAGAVVDGSTFKKAREKGLNIEYHLERNDSNSFFEALGDSIVTGPTGTNVNDLTVILVR